ncbi:Fimbrial assembly protein (PilN) [compost metagenome]|jgi:type IV pilus assembly protein PilN|nr:hypothetical protein CQ065_12690 [Pseudomonas sp. MYb187]
MPGLNLLPWRVRRHQAAVRRLQGMLVAVGLLAVVVVWLLDTQGRQALQRQLLGSVVAHQAIEQEDARLATFAQYQVEHEQIRQQHLALEALHARRFALVDLLEQIERAVPEGVHLATVTRQGQRLNISGVAHSGGLVAQLLRTLADAFGEVDRQQMKAVAEGEAFELGVALRGMP